MKTAVAVTGLGLLSPIGLTPMACMHAVRSGVTRLALQPIPDRVQQWISGGRVPWSTPFPHARHLEALARAAIAQGWRYATERDADSAPKRVAVLLGAPEPGRPGFCFPQTDAEGSAFVDGLAIDGIVHGEVVRAGACQAHTALHRASELFERGVADACVIAAADTLLQLRVVRWLEDQSRLKCSYVTDGLMPAEAAACLVVEPQERAVRRGAPAIATVAAFATRVESATILSNHPNTAAGLTTAVRAALEAASVQPPELSMIWSDLNGESYRAREWAFTEVRLGIQTHSELLHPADCHGDLGAATDAALLAMAAMSVGTGWAGGRPCLVFAGSEGGARGASVVTAAAVPPSLPPVSVSVPRVLSAAFVVGNPPPGGVDEAELSNPLRAEYAWQVREGHRDDLAGLYYQRRALQRDASVAWRRLGEVENRMLGHMDAIVVLGAQAIAVACAGLASDEEGEAWAAAMLVGVLPAEPNLVRLDRALRDATPSRRTGFREALAHAPASETLSAFLGRWLGSEDPAIRAWALELVAARAEPVEPDAVLRALSDPATAEAACRVAMRLAVPGALPFLEPWARDGPPAVQAAAFDALLAVDVSEARRVARSVLRRAGGAAAARTLAILGTAADAPLLAQHAGTADADPVTVEALGILGGPASVPLLLDLLGSTRDEVRAAAGRALALLSGASPSETVRQEFGDDDDPVVATRPSTAIADWQSWWDDARPRAVAAARWRRGAPFSVESCLAEMAAAGTAAHDRERAHLELLALAGAVVPYSAGWFVSRQERAIRAWQARLAGRGSP